MLFTISSAAHKSFSENKCRRRTSHLTELAHQGHHVRDKRNVVQLIRPRAKDAMEIRFFGNHNNIISRYRRRNPVKGSDGRERARQSGKRLGLRMTPQLPSRRAFDSEGARPLSICQFQSVIVFLALLVWCYSVDAAFLSSGSQQIGCQKGFNRDATRSRGHGRRNGIDPTRFPRVLDALIFENLNSKFLASKEDIASSYERKVRAQRKESRFGVRSRVKSVLKKARDRTGIKNSSEGGRYGVNDDSQQQQNNAMKEPLTRNSMYNEDPGSFDSGDTELDVDHVNPGASVSATASAPPRSKSVQTNLPPGVQPKMRHTNAMKGDKKKSKITTENSTPQAEASSLLPNAPILNGREDISTGDPTSSSGRSGNVSKGNDSSARRGVSQQEETSLYAEGDSVEEARDLNPPFPVEPFPFELPQLTADQQRQLDGGERVQFQNDMGREGSGFVVLDVKAPPDVVWDCLLDFQSYPETIPTVRDVTMYTNTHLSGDYRSEKPVAFEDGTLATLQHGIPSVTRAAFTLSKFRLKIAAIHKYRPHPSGDYMVFTLDPACTNLVLKAAKGVWHTQSNPDGKGEEYTRVWLLCEVSVSKLLPQWITDYAARRAMPRATTWLKPQVEAANALWLRKRDKDS